MKANTVINAVNNATAPVRSVAKKTYGTVKKSFLNEVAQNNFKKSLPAALICTGGFSLLSLLPNRKTDGKQNKLEKKSGTFAAVAFAVASFKKFFNAENKTLKNIFDDARKLNFKEGFEKLKTNKSNAIVYLASIIGVKILTDIATKGVDGIVNDVFEPKKLGD